MPMIYLIHICAGSAALLAGFIALYSVKGAALHRKSGRVFFYAMLAVCAGGLLMAIVRGVAPAINIPAGLVTAYLVITALITVRPPVLGRRWLDLGLMLVALTVALGDFWLVYVWDGPSMGFPLFGVIALVAVAGDMRVLRSGVLSGGARLARHLWRMCLALGIAALSFFIGQAHVFPKPIRIMPLLALPMITVLLTMFYWLWRVRTRKPLRGMVERTAAALPARATLQDPAGRPI